MKHVQTRSALKLATLATAAAALTTLTVGAAAEPHAPTRAAPDVAAPRGSHWTLAWSDEFNRGPADLRGWHYDIGGGGWGNNESETYTRSTKNAYVAHGRLHMVVIGKRRHGKTYYTSARINTRNIFSQKYGLFEFRARLPAGPGLWPAIWMMPEKSVYGGWPRSGEIDIMEARGDRLHRVQGSLHSGPAWNQDNTQTKVYVLPRNQTITGWHTYTLEWEPAKRSSKGGARQVAIKWFVDGHLYETQRGGWTDPSPHAGNGGAAPFNRRFDIIMNLAVGGNYTDHKTPGPGRYVMEVDFVRAYRLSGKGR